MDALSDRTRLPRALATLAIGAAGGLAAKAAGLPLPWLLGALLATGAASARGVRIAGGGLWFPPEARVVCVTVIGVLIGAAFSPDLLGAAPGWWPGFLAVLAFVPAAHALNYAVFRGLGGLSRPTAYFAAMPGGLIEAIEIGEGEGADVRALTVLQFARIAIVVTALPLIFSAVEGRAVGSAGGATLDPGLPIGLRDAILLTAAGVAGYVLAREARAPAAQITGPIVASALVHGIGLTEAAPPPWLVAAAQLAIGVSLGIRFVGIGGRALRGYLALSAISVAGMLALGAGLAVGLAAAGFERVATMMLALAPGGVVEMGLIALSLGASPIFVTACHLARIVATVAVGLGAWRLMARRDGGG
jgi:membrane AbrB-like protein